MAENILTLITVIRYVINLIIFLCVLEHLSIAIDRKKFLSLVVKEMNLARFLLLSCILTIFIAIA